MSLQCLSVASPINKEKKIIFDKFGEEMTKEEIQAEIEKQKIPSYEGNLDNHCLVRLPNFHGLCG